MSQILTEAHCKAESGIVHNIIIIVGNIIILLQELKPQCIEFCFI